MYTPHTQPVNFLFKQSTDSHTQKPFCLYLLTSRLAPSNSLSLFVSSKNLSRCCPSDHSQGARALQREARRLGCSLGNCGVFSMGMNTIDTASCRCGGGAKAVCSTLIQSNKAIWCRLKHAAEGCRVRSRELQEKSA
jgi:hypothetical protein